MSDPPTKPAPPILTNYPKGVFEMIADKRKSSKFIVNFFGSLMAFIICTVFTGTSAVGQPSLGFEKAPPAVIESVAGGQSEEIIVLFDDTAVKNEAGVVHRANGASHDPSWIHE